MLSDALDICLSAINSCLPDQAVKEELKKLDLQGPVYLLAAGKAAYTMAAAACEVLDVRAGIVISKYNHIKGDLPHIRTFEAGHPLVDENSVKATKELIDMVSNLSSDDKVVFLLSGGASALLEMPLIPLEELIAINDQMLKKGLDIYEINTIRKKLSMIKGGGLARICAPAAVYGIILSDVIEDRLDVIGSGPSVTDESTAQEALDIIKKYDLQLSPKALQVIEESEPWIVNNAKNTIIGSVRILCQNACLKAKELGYQPILLCDKVTLEAREAGDLLSEEILKHENDQKTALIMGGETVVKVKGNGKGGRCSELVFSQIEHLKGLEGVLLMALGSDGTDGPTDAAGGWIDGHSADKLAASGISFSAILENNDSYNGLKVLDQLVFTGPTGTNVNDLMIALISRA